MSTITENDLKEVKELITQLNNRMITQNGQVNEKLNDMKVDIATLKEGQSGINKRLDSIDTRLNTLIAVMFTSLLGIIAKLIFVK
ncbi:hypothetical protein ACN4EE_04240 [Geminocystis sp. CENA526]|uniref:hypothetical protein n=1 Tax=Geminocystis sp. CENA526 TaxID=1355871 RepID=UPI003D6FD9C1